MVEVERKWSNQQLKGHSSIKMENFRIFSQTMSKMEIGINRNFMSWKCDRRGKVAFNFSFIDVPTEQMLELCRTAQICERFICRRFMRSY